MHRGPVLFLVAMGCMAIFAGLAPARGGEDFLGYCKSIVGKYPSVSVAIETQMEATRMHLHGWYEQPANLPGGELVRYRRAVRLAALRGWEGAAVGRELIGTLKSGGERGAVAAHFFRNVYRRELSENGERDLALRIFKLDYETGIKGKIDESVERVRTNLAAASNDIDSACADGAVSRVFMGSIGRPLVSVDGDRRGPGGRSGDVAGIIQATTGISLTRIMSSGLVAGPGGELAGFGEAWADGLDALGIDEASFLREAAASGPTSHVPGRSRILVDDMSLDHVFDDPAPRAVVTGPLIVRQLPAEPASQAQPPKLPAPQKF